MMERPHALKNCGVLETLLAITTLIYISPKIVFPKRENLFHFFTKNFQTEFSFRE